MNCFFFFFSTIWIFFFVQTIPSSPSCKSSLKGFQCKLIENHVLVSKIYSVLKSIKKLFKKSALGLSCGSEMDDLRLEDFEALKANFLRLVTARNKQSLQWNVVVNDSNEMWFSGSRLNSSKKFQISRADANEIATLHSTTITITRSTFRIKND